jgi:hypothetical protein
MKRTGSLQPGAYRVITDTPEADLPHVHYGSAPVAIAGAVWHARRYPRSLVKVERFDHQQGRYVHHTQTQGAATR